MPHQLPLNALMLLLRVVSIFVGVLLVYWEAQNATDNRSTGEEAKENWEKQGLYSDMLSPWRIDRHPPANLLFGIPYLGIVIVMIMQPELWIFIGIGLIASAILPPAGNSPVLPVLLTAALVRIAFFRLTAFAPNRHKFLVGNKVFQLIGQNGIVTTDVTPENTGSVRMKNPIFKNDVMDCIADETIRAGTEVKVLEVDCGMLKITRAKGE